MSTRRRKHSFEEDPKAKRFKGDELSYSLLRSIDKRKLDFDFVKSCSVTLSKLNVYCCLVCGKYLHGRSPNSPAFLHSVDEGHHVYVNFSNLKFYLLPEGTELEDDGTNQLLNSLRYAIRPTFTKDEIEQFPRDCVDLSNHHYINGFVGLNDNIKFKAINAILLAMAHMNPIRDYLLLADLGGESEFIRRLGVIVRKLWSVKLFKTHISAEEFVSFVLVNDSNAAGIMSDPRKCFLWLFDCISKSSAVLKDLVEHHCRGKVLITKTAIKTLYDESHNVKEFKREGSAINSTLPFSILTLDLPRKPLFKSGFNINDLPQVRLEELMTKFNGQKEKHMSHHILRYQIKQFPDFLVLHFDRFERKSQQPVRNRNQAIVEFPLSMVIENHRYALLANIIHVAVKPSAAVEQDEESKWITQLYNEKQDEWLEFDGTSIRKRDKELLFLNETFIQIWQKKSPLVL